MNKFNFKSSVCTSIEQSQRLIALGLKKETADMHWANCMGNSSGTTYYLEVGTSYYNCDIPAWSLHRLIEMIKKSDYLHYNDMGCIKLYVEQDDFDTAITIISIMVKEEYFNKEYLV